MNKSRKTRNITKWNIINYNLWLSKENSRINDTFKNYKKLIFAT